MAALGSIGKKKDEDTNGDIDIAIKIDSKEELNNIVDTCFSDCEINYNTMKTITSIGYKYDIDGYKGIAQIDFMIVKNMDWAKAYYHSPNLKTGESKYKGMVRTTLLNDIISCLPVKDVKDEYFEDGVTVKRHWKHTFNTEGVFIQLVDYCGKNGKPVKTGKKLKEFEIDLHLNESKIYFYDNNQLLKIFKKFIEYPKTESFTVVGDINQSIYAFRGSSKNYFKELTDKYSDKFEEVYLSTNYRSTEEIIDISRISLQLIMTQQMI